MASAGRNTAFAGRTLTGRVCHLYQGYPTVLDGRLDTPASPPGDHRRTGLCTDDRWDRTSRDSGVRDVREPGSDPPQTGGRGHGVAGGAGNAPIGRVQIRKKAEG
jgi:hypothetical protein